MMSRGAEAARGYGALANRHDDLPQWFRRGTGVARVSGTLGNGSVELRQTFRRGTGVAKPGCPCPE